LFLALLAMKKFLNLGVIAIVAFARKLFRGRSTTSS
jgi:hypothetical protein